MADPASGKRWKETNTAAGLRGAGSSLSDSGREEMDRAESERISPVQYHRGGKVRKGGVARLLKGERVVSRGKEKKVRKMMRKAGMRLKARR